MNPFKAISNYFERRDFEKKMRVLEYEYGLDVKAAVLQEGTYEECFQIQIEDKAYAEALDLFLRDCFIKRVPIEQATQIVCRSVDLYNDKQGRFAAIGVLLDGVPT